MKNNRLCQLLGIDFPVIQAGMVWCSGWKLAYACSSEGILGVIGAGSMTAELLEEHVNQFQSARPDLPFGVNIPLFNQHSESHIHQVIKNKVPVVITSGGNPKIYTQKLKEQGAIVGHVVANLKFAKKAAEAGVDFIIGEGFEAGGHNGRDELTTLVLLQVLKEHIDIPIVAAGGIASGQGLLACMALGAEGVQIGSLFASCSESSAHDNFKQSLFEADDNSTVLTLKEITPVRLLKNKFYQQLQEVYKQGGSPDELKELLGKGRSRLGIFEGNLEEGELEIGQITALLHEEKSAKEIITQIKEQYTIAVNALKGV